MLWWTTCLTSLTLVALPSRFRLRIFGRRRRRVLCGQERQIKVLLKFVLLLLLPSQRYLGGHDSLAFRNETTVWTRTVLPLAKSLVAFEDWNHAVVPASSALGRTKCVRSLAFCRLTWPVFLHNHRGRLSNVLRNERTSVIHDGNFLRCSTVFSTLYNILSLSARNVNAKVKGNGSRSLFEKLLITFSPASRDRPLFVTAK